MKIDRTKIENLRAIKCLTVSDLIAQSKIGRTTFYKAYKEDVNAAVIGKIARALNVPVTAIIIDEPDQEVTA